MNRRLLELELAKDRLVAQSDALRQRFALAAGGLRPALGVADRLRQGVDWLRRHPPLLLALLVAAIVARPRAALRLAGRGLMAWRTLRRLGQGAREVGALGEAVWERWKNRGGQA